MKRGQKLHTWFYNTTYIMQSGLIVEYRDDSYLLMNTSVIAKVSLPLQVSPTDTTLAYTLFPGDEVILPSQMMIDGSVYRTHLVKLDGLK